MTGIIILRPYRKDARGVGRTDLMDRLNGTWSFREGAWFPPAGQRIHEAINALCDLPRIPDFWAGSEQPDWMELPSFMMMPGRHDRAVLKET